MVSNPNILLASPTSLDLQAQASRNNLLDAQAREVASRAISRGSQAVGNALAQNSPMAQQMRQNALTRDNVGTIEAERALIAPLLDQVAQSADPATAYAAAVQYAEGNGIDIPDGFEVYDPQNFEMMRRVYAMPQAELTDFQRKIALAGPENAQDAALIALGLKPDANAVLRGQTGDQTLEPTSAMQEYEFAKMEGFEGSFADWKRMQKGNGISFNTKTGELRVGGGSPLGRSASNTEQKSLAAETNLLGQLQTVRDYAGIGPDGRMSPEGRAMLTYQGQAEDYISRIADKLGIAPEEAEREAVRRKTKFVTSVEQLFNAYRKEITGAAAAVQELDRLKKSFINIDMSPTQFEAAYEQYETELKRSMRVRRKLLREGFDLTSEEGGSQMDREFLTGGDDDPVVRFGELVQEVGEDEAYRLMAEEGY